MKYLDLGRKLSTIALLLAVLAMAAGPLLEPWGVSAFGEGETYDCCCLEDCRYCDREWTCDAGAGCGQATCCEDACGKPTIE